MEPDSLLLGLKLGLSTEVIFGIAGALTKLSMLALTARIMGNSGYLKVWIRAALMFIVAEVIVFTFLDIFQCRYVHFSRTNTNSNINSPYSDYWKLTSDPQPNCFNEGNILLVAGIFDTVSDLVVVILPIPKVWQLKLPNRETIIVIALFGTGFMVALAGAVRTIFICRIERTWDRTWVTHNVWLAASVGLYLDVVSSLITPLNPNLTYILDLCLYSSHQKVLL